ncbi:MAG: choice-of-anchor D domain-containing protein [Bacteroidetes bacterium]|nr:MAG: choice-of-anchor D domain-containing protein [Bacteroidota bacterium]
MQKFVTLYIFLIFSVLPLTSLSQSWNKVSTIPAPYSNNYWLDVYFLPSNPEYGWICGYRGQVIRTSDRGKTWAGSVVAFADQLESVHFTSPTVGYTSGMDGIFKSVNSGASWFEITPPGALQLWGNFFLDDNYGVVVGEGCNGYQKFWRTTNGGTNWSVYIDSVPNSGMADVILYNNGLGYASSSGKVWRTLDSGATWAVLSTSGPNIWQEEMTNIGNSFLVPFGGTSCSGAGNNGGMHFSTDNGSTWNHYTTGISMYGAFLIDQMKGWVCGLNREVYYTSDGGLTWLKRNCGIDRASLDDIWFITPTEGWVVGEGVYYLGPDRQDITKQSIFFGDVCVPGFKYDTLWVRNHSFNNAYMASTNLYGTNFEDFTVASAGSFALSPCDSQMIIVGFIPKTPGDNKNAKLGVNIIGGTTFTIDLLGNAKEMTAVPKDTLVEINPAFCGMKTVDSLEWTSSSPANIITAIQKVEGTYEIVSESTLPINVYTNGVYTNFSSSPPDTGWFTSRFKVTLLPCMKDTFITVRAYGVSPIITSDDRINLNLICKLSDYDTIPVHNTGNSVLEITDYQFNQANKAFSYNGWTSGRTLPVTINPTESDSLIIKFTPPINGSHSAVLTLTNNDSTKIRGRKNPFYISISGIATSTDVIPKDSVFDLGDICLGDSAVIQLPIKNRGDLTATLQNPIVNNKLYKVSIQGKTFPVQMRTNDSLMCRITFKPDSTKFYNDTITISSLPCFEVMKIVVKANCIDSYLTLEPDSISGTIQTGLPLRKTVTVHAFGNIPMSINSIRLDPPGAGWTINPSPTLPYNILGGESVDFTIDFTSSKDTLLDAGLVFGIESQCPMETGIPVKLLSHSVWLLTSADSVGFGFKKCSPVLVYDTLTITNGGSIDDTLTRLEVQPQGLPFGIINMPSLPHVIPAGISENYIISFDASIEGNFSGSIFIDSKNLRGLSINLPVSGEYRRVNSIPPAVGFDYGDVEPCEDTIVRAFYLKNTGTLTDSLSISRKNNLPGFNIIPANNLIVNSNDSVLVKVILIPEEFNNQGNFSEQFTLTSEVCNVIHTIDADVNIIKPHLTIEPAILEFKNIWIGDSAIKYIDIKNETNYNKIIDSLAIVPPSNQFKFISSYPIIIVPDGSLRIPVTFIAKTEGQEQTRFEVIEKSVCIDTSYVELLSDVPKEIYNTTVKLGNYRAEQMDTLTIEAELIDAVPRVKPDKLDFSMAYNKRLFYPLRVSVKSGNSKQPVNFNYLGDTIKASIDKRYSEEILKEAGNIIFIDGLILYSFPDSTGLFVAEFKPQTNKVVNINKIDGSLKVLNVCPATGGFYLKLENRLKTELGESVINTDNLIVKVLIPETQVIDADIWDVLGNRVHSERINIKDETSSFSIPVTGLYSGAYILTLKSDKSFYAKYNFIIYR